MRVQVADLQFELKKVSEDFAEFKLLLLRLGSKRTNATRIRGLTFVELMTFTTR